MAKKWMPQVGETYIVRSSDNGVSGAYFGTIYVTEVLGNPTPYRGTKTKSCSVRGTYLDERGKVSTDSQWKVGKAGLVKDLPFV